MFPISFYIGLILIGIFAGFASGLLGVGGGFLMVPLQFFLFSSVGVDPSLAMMVSLGTSWQLSFQQHPLELISIRKRTNQS